VFAVKYLKTDDGSPIHAALVTPVQKTKKKTFLSHSYRQQSRGYHRHNFFINVPFHDHEHRKCPTPWSRRPWRSLTKKRGPRRAHRLSKSSSSSSWLHLRPEDARSCDSLEATARACTEGVHKFDCPSGAGVIIHSTTFTISLRIVDQ
jgi:hypothetical protein